MAEGPAPAGALRLDKWLWHARFAKSRSIAAKMVSETGVRVNGARAARPSSSIRPGDVLTFAAGGRIRVVKVLDLGVRRGPAHEAQALYDDLDPPQPRAEEPAPEAPQEAPPPERDKGAGRPSKAERRALDRLRDRDLG